MLPVSRTACLFLLALCIGLAADGVRAVDREAARSLGAEPRGQVHLRTGRVTVPSINAASEHGAWEGTRGLQGDVEDADSCEAEVRRLKLIILSLNHRVNEEAHRDVSERLSTSGVISSYLPHDAYLVLGDERKVVELARESDRVHGILEYRGHHKQGLDSRREGVVHDVVDAEGTLGIWISVLLPKHVDRVLLTTEACAGMSPSRAIARVVCGDLASEYGDAVVCRQDSPARIVVRANEPILSEVVESLKGQNAVHSVEYAPVITHQSVLASAVVQSGKATELDSISMPYDHEYLPWWNHDLLGQGQIIGVSDSGLDHQSCFFRDDDVPVTFNDTVGGSVAFVSDDHRKLTMYRCVTGDCEDNTGHGTHVAGTAAGAVSSTYAQKFNGIAPSAKIAFTDLGDDILEYVSLKDNIYPAAYDRGVKIHSDSWGLGSSQYDSVCTEVDLFTWENDDFVAVFPVGNAGNYYEHAMAPAIAKNTIAVGSSKRYEPHISYSMDTSVLDVTATGSRDFDVTGEGTFAGQKAHNFGGSWDGFGKHEIVLAAPDKACSPLTNDDEVAGKVVLIKRGTCTFTTKVRYAQQAGALAVFVFNNEETGFPMMGALPLEYSDDITIPALSLSKKQGRRLKAALKRYKDRVDVEVNAVAESFETFELLSDYSAFGPSEDGRIKPDVVAPGETQSASMTSGDSQCSTSWRSGTSISAPVVAGGIALIRQYFTQGLYTVDGVSQHMQPSGALLKAVLLNGATPLRAHLSEDGVGIDAAPSYEQGFGRMLLKNSLPVGNAFDIFVRDSVEILSDEMHSYCIQTSDDAPLHVTLAWYDYPSDSSSSVSLVNDLDLRVHVMDTGFDFYGNGGTKHDRTNTVEQVRLSASNAGKYTIEVKADRIGHPGQKYALVVTGQFVNADGHCELESALEPVIARIVRSPTEAKMNTHTATFEVDAYDIEKEVVHSSDVYCKLAACDYTYPTLPAYHDWRVCPTQQDITYSDLADGTYCFSVRYQESQYYTTDDSADEVRSLIVDTLPPQTHIVSRPDALSGDRDAFISFFGKNQDGDFFSTIDFACTLSRIEGSGESAREVVVESSDDCASPQFYSNIDDGSYVFRVVARDDVGNVEADGPSVFFTVDAIAPRTRLLDPLPPASTSATSVPFYFDTQGESEGTPPTFECALVTFVADKAALDASLDAAWFPCTSPFLAGSDETPADPSPSGLVDGTYHFAVRATDAVGNVDDKHERQTFRVDTVAPEVSIYKHPATQTDASSLGFFFDASEASADVTFECRLALSIDVQSGEAPWQPNCKSPAYFFDKKEGLWVFSLRATDGAGNRGPEDDVYVHIDRSPPSIAVNFAGLGEPNLMGDGVGAYEDGFMITTAISDGPGSGVGNSSCWLVRDQTEVVHHASPCPATMEVGPRASLEDGSYALEVLAIDNVGNTAFLVSAPAMLEPPCSRACEPCACACTTTQACLGAGGDLIGGDSSGSNDGTSGWHAGGISAGEQEGEAGDGSANGNSVGSAQKKNVVDQAKDFVLDNAKIILIALLGLMLISMAMLVRSRRSKLKSIETDELGSIGRHAAAIGVPVHMVDNYDPDPYGPPIIPGAGPGLGGGHGGEGGALHTQASAPQATFVEMMPHQAMPYEGAYVL